MAKAKSEAEPRVAPRSVEACLELKVPSLTEEGRALGELLLHHRQRLSNWKAVKPLP